MICIINQMFRGTFTKHFSAGPGCRTCQQGCGSGFSGPRLQDLSAGLRIRFQRILFQRTAVAGLVSRVADPVSAGPGCRTFQQGFRLKSKNSWICIDQSINEVIRNFIRYRSVFVFKIVSKFLLGGGSEWNQFQPGSTAQQLVSNIALIEKSRG